MANPDAEIEKLMKPKELIALVKSVKETVQQAYRKKDFEGCRVFSLQYNELLEASRKTFRESVSIAFLKEMPEVGSFQAHQTHIVRRFNELLSNISMLYSAIEAQFVDAKEAIIMDRDFSFVSDEEIRGIIKRDYREVQKLVAVEAHKAILILCGSLLEALLLDAVKNEQSKGRHSSKAPRNQPDDWYLSDLISVAVDLDIVNPGVDMLSTAVREYRNLVHPSREIKSKLMISAEESRIGFEILNIVIRDMEKRA